MERIQTFDEMYRETTLKALARTRSTMAAAKLMGITERCLHRWKRRWGIYWDADYQQYVIKEKNNRICLVANQIVIVRPATLPPSAILK